jgi:hypothetical protein
MTTSWASIKPHTKTMTALGCHNTSTFFTVNSSQTSRRHGTIRIKFGINWFCSGFACVDYEVTHLYLLLLTMPADRLYNRVNKNANIKSSPLIKTRRNVAVLAVCGDISLSMIIPE